MGCLSSKPEAGASKYAMPPDAGDAASPSPGTATPSPKPVKTPPQGNDDDTSTSGSARSDPEDPALASPLNLRASGMTERRVMHKSRSKGSLADGGAAQGAPAGRVGDEDEVAFLNYALMSTVVFRELDADVRDRVARSMTRLAIPRDYRLIVEGDAGDELYLVQDGIFAVSYLKDGVEVVVNKKAAGDIFGEIALMFESPRTATVTARTDGTVWVLTRESFRALVRQAAEAETSATEGARRTEVFLNSVPLLASLDAGKTARLAEVLRRRDFPPGARVLEQGAPCVETNDDDAFFIVVDGEAVVTVSDDVKETETNAIETPRVANRLFRGDFFGESALDDGATRAATVAAVGPDPLRCLTLDRDGLVTLLAPLRSAMREEKSPQKVARRMAALKGETPLRAATFEIRAPLDPLDPPGADPSVSARRPENEVVAVARGSCSSATFASESSTLDSEIRVVLVEGALLGGGSSGTVRRVDVVDDRLGGGALKKGGVTRSFALKRVRKTSVMSTPEHIFCERNVTREVTHWACVKQHASFKDETYLYFLLDYVNGYDLMDALAAVAAVTTARDPSRTFAPRLKMLRGMPEDAARYYVATVTLALEYLHDRGVVYRDLKPENVLLARDGSAKLGDFGFAKRLKKGARTYTFCGTPGYVAPEVVLARGYGTSVDWWGLGVMMYVLLTGQQPFSQMVNGQPEDPLTVMKRIVDRSWSVSFPVYVSESGVDLIRRFLERRSVKRLGSARRGAEDVRDHLWFAGARFDWAGLRDGALKPKPLAFSENFEKQRARRIARLERSLRDASADATVSEEKAADADAVFANF